MAAQAQEDRTMRIRARYDDLAGRRALVTGASSGIGLGIAGAFLEQGMAVAVHCHTHRAEAEALAARWPGRAFPVQADLGSAEACAVCVRSAAAALGGLDQLVHSAATWSGAGLAALTAEDLERTFRVNTFSAFHLVREALPLLRAGDPGNVVLIGSTAGQRGEAGHADYAASKGALQSLAMSLAVELAPAVRVNLVSPGWVDTPMAASVLAERGADIAGAIPNGRVATVEDVVHAVLYLASGASGHLVGEDLGVSGGALLVVPRGQIVRKG